MSKRNVRLSRGDRRRNAKLARLREIVTPSSAVLAFDLAEDKQVCVLTGQDSQVLARRTFRVKAWQLREALEWGLEQAGQALPEFTSVVVACEPTGHRWRVLNDLATDVGLRLMCVQPMLVHRAREGEDFTRNKNDNSDAMIIARLVTELRCYLPEVQDPAWARLRQLGQRQAELVVKDIAVQQRIQDLLGCAWPAVLSTAKEPLNSINWLAAVDVVLTRIETSGELSLIRRWGWNRYLAAVRKTLPAYGGKRSPFQPIVRGVFDAAADPARAAFGVVGQRSGILERVRFGLDELVHLRAEIAEVEGRMLDALDQLDLLNLASSIPGVTPVGAATVLAASGDPSRFDSARAMVKHAGLCPRDNASGGFEGQALISRRGRPALRLAAWRVGFGAIRNNPVFAARYHHLTTREQHQLAPGQAQVAIACSLLRQLHAIITTRTPWNADTAAGQIHTDHTEEAIAA